MKKEWTEISIPLADKLFSLVDDYLKGLGSLGNVMQTVVSDDDSVGSPCMKGYFEGSPASNQEKIDAFSTFIGSLKELFPTGQIGELQATRTTEKEWAQWKKFFRPTAVSDRVVIKPSWEAYSPKKEEVIIDIDPGMAFGTGTHETTRLCIVFLDRLMKGGERVFDLGTGSGILAIAAAKLGAARVVATDIDASAVAVAKENVQKNGVASLVELSTTPLAEVTGPFDIVVANILAEVLIAMKREIFRHVREGGRLILSGILRSKARLVIDAYTAEGMILEETLEEGEWSTLQMRR